MQISLFATNEQLKEYALNNSPPEVIHPSLKFWMEVKQPSIREIILNPAIRPSNECKASTLILADQDGQYHEYVVIDGDLYDIDGDGLIQWATIGREAPRHDTGLVGLHMSHDPEDGFIRGVHKHCQSNKCSYCANYNLQRKTIEHAQKVEEAQKYVMRTQGKKYARLQHIEVSPPPSEWLRYLTPEGYAKGKRTAFKLIKEAGLLGGAVVFHPFRQNKRDNGKTPEEWTASEDNTQDGLSCRWGPHFHIVGVGFIDPHTVSEIHARTGWVIKALRTGEEALNKPSEVLPVLKYIKTHAGVIPSDSPYQPPKALQSVNWFGLCAPNVRVEVGGIQTYTEEISPENGARLNNYLVHTGGDIEDKGLLYSSRKYPIFAPYSRREEARALVEANKGVPFDLLGELDKNPRLAVCVLSRRQLIGLCNPVSVKTLDGTLHCINTEASVYVKNGKHSTNDTPRPPDPERVPSTSGASSEVCVPPASDIPEGGIPWIDYHYPVGAGWIG